MSIVSSYKSLPRVVQILLLFPGIGWITEIVVRLSAAIHGKGTQQILVFICVIFFGLIVGIIDLIWVIVYKRLILT